jgi:hypothetical protein
MISLIASSAVDHGFDSWSGKTKDFKMSIELFVEALLPPSLLHRPNFVRKSMLTLQLEKFGCKT